MGIRRANGVTRWQLVDIISLILSRCHALRQSLYPFRTFHSRYVIARNTISIGP